MKVRGVLSYLIVLFFIGWCGIAFQEDLAKIRFEPIWAGRYWVLLAALLTLFNYSLRILRWFWYLKRLGHSIPFGFSALTYLAGFAFTLSLARSAKWSGGGIIKKSASLYPALRQLFLLNGLWIYWPCWHWLF